MPLLAVFHAIIGTYLRHEKGRTLLTLFGVALGVAVLVAIDLANESAVASFKRTVDDVAGAAQLTIRGNGSGLDGKVVAAVARDPRVLSAAPLISGWANYCDGERRQSMMLLGVDFLMSEERGPAAVRQFDFQLQQGRDLVTLLTDPEVMIFTTSFVQRHGLKPGDKVTLEIGGKPRAITVGGIINGGALSETVDGNVVVGDIASADALLHRGGLIDRIDITLRDGVDAKETAAALEKKLSRNVIVERPERRGAQVDEMLLAFRFNLRALGQISVLVGAFLIFNTMSVAVARRRSAIGTLRAMGVRAATIRTVFVAEGALMGLVGGIGGVLLGIGMAKLMLAPVSQAISINFVQTEAHEVVLSPMILAGSLLLGVLGSIVAALLPAQEAAATPPANTMRRGTQEAGRWSLVAWILAGFGFAVVAGVLLNLEPPRGLPIFGYAASTLCVAAFTCWARPMLLAISALSRLPMVRFFRAEGILAVAGTRATIGRSSIAVCGLTISLGMTIAVGVMVSSFRDTVVTWMSQVLVADLYITALASDPMNRPGALPGELADVLQHVDGVDVVDAFRSRTFELNGRRAYIGGGGFDAIRFTSKTVDGRPAQQVYREAKARGELVISEAFARKHELRQGDTIPVPTKDGVRRLRINAVYYDYSTEQGFAIMDRGLFRELYHDDQLDSVALYLKPGADRRAVRKAVEQATRSIPGAPPLMIRANDDLREFALMAFDKTFAITYALQAIAVVVAILGVTTTLLAQILDRRTEILTLRFIGASQRLVSKIVVLESSLIGAAGVVLGVANGLALSWILTRVIMLQSFGWTIAFRISWSLVAEMSAVVFVATLIAALIPAREAGKSSSGSMQTMAG